MEVVKIEHLRLIPDRTSAESQDAVDPLATFRDRFFIEDRLLYMDGNSLGRLPRASIDRIRTVVEEEWGKALVGSWHRWIDLPTKVGDTIGQLIGARPGEVTVCDSTSVNLYKLIMSAVHSQGSRNVIVTDTDNFPSDRYVLQGVSRQTGMRLEMFRPDPIDGPDVGSLAPYLSENVSLVCLSQVGYKNSALADMENITRAVHDAGGLVLWDLCHSVGALPVDLNSCGVDLAVGCTYKYLNGGPGSPAFLFVREDLQQTLLQPIWGWFGQSDQFLMGTDYKPDPSIRRFQTGTPPIISLIGVDEGASLTAEAGLGRIREKSVAITEMMVELHDSWLEPLGVDLVSPRDPKKRGSHLAFRHPDAYRVCQALIDQLNVIPDFREPDVIRYGIAPLYTRFVDAWDAMERLRHCLEEGLQGAYPQDRARVT